MTFLAVNAFVCTNFDMVMPMMLFCPMHLCFHCDNSFTLSTKFCGGLVILTTFTVIQKIISTITDCFCAKRAIYLVEFCFCVWAVEIPNEFSGCVFC